MTKKEVTTVLNHGTSHLFQIEGFPLGVTKFQSFLAISQIIHGKLYWYALRYAYESSDNLYHYRHDVAFAFSKDEPEREYLMTKKEREYLQRLPEQITIYRGMTQKELKSKNFGVSWTLKKDVAEFFAYTYQRNFATNHLKKLVHEMTINKSEVIAFFNGRDEFEIIYIKDNGNKS
jgi:hypothetical protein